MTDSNGHFGKPRRGAPVKSVSFSLEDASKAVRMATGGISSHQLSQPPSSTGRQHGSSAGSQTGSRGGPPGVMGSNRLGPFGLPAAGARPAPPQSTKPSNVRSNMGRDDPNPNPMFGMQSRVDRLARELDSVRLGVSELQQSRLQAHPERGFHAPSSFPSPHQYGNLGASSKHSALGGIEQYNIINGSYKGVTSGLQPHLGRGGGIAPVANQRYSQGGGYATSAKRSDLLGPPRDLYNPISNSQYPTTYGSSLARQPSNGLNPPHPSPQV